MLSPLIMYTPSIAVSTGEEVEKIRSKELSRMTLIVWSKPFKSP